MNELEFNIQKYSQLKMDLFKLAKQIDCCNEENDKNFYQDVAIVYSKEIKALQKYIEGIYGLKFCNCCNISNE